MPTMRTLLRILGLSAALALPLATAVAEEAQPSTQPSQQQETQAVPQALNFTMKSLNGKPINLSEKYKGKVVLMVNVASKCGLTPQYKQLQALHEQYTEKGLSILGFPANDFGAQEPGTDEQIAEFCERNYGVDFDMFSKITVKGDAKHDLYKVLTTAQGEQVKPGEISWNFEKFLIGRDGQIVARFSPQTKPDAPEVTGAIEAELAKKGA
ncbi:MAG: glutathione peroxidase [Tepidisphaeraceae bacterium]